MAMTYLVKLAISLRPIWHADPPRVRIGINNNLSEIVLTESTTINFEFTAVKDCQLIVELLNKTDADTIPDRNLDKAVVIESVDFFGIADPRFAWTGIYEPVYPEPWAQEQQDQGVALKRQLCPHTYLSWNGKWTLTFGVPVFTWIHQIQNLGWLYG
jgi:hypothetical protein